MVASLNGRKHGRYVYGSAAPLGERPLNGEVPPPPPNPHLPILPLTASGGLIQYTTRTANITTDRRGSKFEVYYLELGPILGGQATKRERQILYGNSGWPGTARFQLIMRCYVSLVELGNIRPGYPCEELFHPGAPKRADRRRKNMMEQWFRTRYLAFAYLFGPARFVERTEAIP